jgi:hypothetical protein
MMIARIVVGAGSRRVVVPLAQDKEQRRSIAGAVKRHLFPTHTSFQKAKGRGQRALGMA